MELDQIAKLKRYFFLGRLTPVYVPRKTDSLIEDLDTVKELVATIDGSSFLTLVKNQTQREEPQLPRRNEVWFTYAVYLSACERVDDRKKVYQAFPDVAPSAEDIFAVVHYAWLIQKKKGSKGHSRTIRKAVALWYESKSEMDIIEMLEKNRGMYGLTHKDLIAFSHINMEKVGLSNLHSVLFKPAAKALLDTDAFKADNCEQLKKVLELKTCKDPVKALQLIKSGKVSMESVPSDLLRRNDVWQALIPQLNYQQLLMSMFQLIDWRLIEIRTLRKAFLKSIDNMPAMTAANVSPISMLIYAKKLQTKKRYSERKKASYYAQKVTRNHIKDHPMLGFKIMTMFKASYGHLKPRTGLKFCIAINMQTSYDTKSVINQTQVSCTEAAVALALAYYRSESKVDIYTYTPMQTVMQKLAWTPGISYDDAQVICKSKQSPKNAQRLHVPIAEANKKQDDYDVFLIIVPSAGRGNPSHKPDKLIQNLNEYRKNKNERARVIIVNLRRYIPAMIHDKKKVEDNGILEICGFGENIINIINAFATHAFS